MVRLSATFLLLFLLAWPAHAQSSTRVDGDHFAVVCHFDNQALARAALAQIERLWKPASELYDLTPDALKNKLVVHLYRDARAYEKAEHALTGGRFKRNLAFAHYDSVTAHVALQPDISDEVLARIGLPMLTRSMILHEAAHLIRYRTMPNHRSHPRWFSDGIAQTLKHSILFPGAWEKTPLSSNVMTQVQRLQERGDLPSARSVMTVGTGDLSFYDRYAVHCMFVRYLYESDRKVMTEIVTQARRLGGGGDFAKRLAAVVDKALGKERAATLNADFAASVAALKPEWEQVFRSLAPAKNGYMVIAFPESNAIAWRTNVVGKKNYTLSARVEILQGARQQLNVLLDRSDEGFLCVALNAGNGVTLFEYTSKDSRWNRISFRKHPALVIGKPFEVRATVAGETLEVRIGNDVVMTAKFPARGMQGAWGLGALSGSAGIWTGVKLQ